MNLEVMEKLKPEHFRKGGSFDKKVFASLIELVKKHEDRRKKANRFMWIFINSTVFCVALFLFGGDAFNSVLNDHPWLLALFFVALTAWVVIVLLWRIFRGLQESAFKQIDEVCITLGLTKEDLQEAIVRLGKELESRGET